MYLASSSPKLDSETQACKRRKVAEIEKTVVTVRIGENAAGKLKNGGPPSDSWSWRKYGQKIIKGSPYPRGYYRCTSKGCSAKKQVERCRTDASMLVITYSSVHNHPSPNLQDNRRIQQPNEKSINSSKQEILKAEETQGQPMKMSKEHGSEDSFQYLLNSPIRSAQDMIINREEPLSGNIEKSHDMTLGFVLDEEHMISCPHHHHHHHHHVMAWSSPKSEGNDIFDELEELCPHPML